MAIGGMISPLASIETGSKKNPSFSVIISYLPSANGVTIIKWPNLLLLSALAGLPSVSFISRIAFSTIFPSGSTTCPTIIFALVGGVGGADSGEKVADCRLSLFVPAIGLTMELVRLQGATNSSTGGKSCIFSSLATSRGWILGTSTFL